MTKKKNALILVLLFVFTCGFCLFLYQFDNKYTQTTAQPIQGLYLWEGDDLTYLTRQWIFCPDVLLTPETYGQYNGYRTYVDIGGTPVSADLGTYQLTLQLPDTPQTYALAWPEVFSACSVFVGDQLMLQVGNPDTGEQGLTREVIPFSAQGNTTILVQMACDDSMYRGLTYPPGFGTVTAVLDGYMGQLLLHGTTVIIAILGSILFLIFGGKSNGYRGFWGVFLCLSVAALTSYPLVQDGFVTKVTLWHGLDVVSYYGVLLSAMLLLYDFCGFPRKSAFFRSMPCVLLLLFALCYLIIPAPILAQILSILVPLVKIYCGISLLVVSVVSLWRGRLTSLLPVCGAISFGICLLWDRLFPLYEPIYGAWFGELGCILLALLLSTALWNDAMEAYRFRLSYRSIMDTMTAQLARQKQHYQEMAQKIEATRQASHDLRHHIRTLKTLALEGDMSQVAAYLEHYEPSLAKSQWQIWSENPVADAILNHYATITRNLGGAYDVRLILPPTFPFPDEELCTILGNLLENATEAMSTQTDGPRRLYLRGEAVQGQLQLYMENTFDGHITQREGLFLSRKHQGLGIGLSSVQSVVTAHGGLADFSWEDTLFRSSILIPLAPSP